MSTARSFATATRLPNDQVLIAGGRGTGFVFLASAELYDPETGMFVSTGSMATGRIYHTATLMPSGKVLIAGGIHDVVLASAELYDPAVGTFSATASMTLARDHATATLTGSEVLVAGGAGSGLLPINSAEIYVPNAIFYGAFEGP
jgi:hypothetical protein